jgi:hypothetical protein
MLPILVTIQYLFDTEVRASVVYGHCQNAPEFLFAEFLCLFWKINTIGLEEVLEVFILDGVFRHLEIFDGRAINIQNYHRLLTRIWDRGRPEVSLYQTDNLAGNCVMLRNPVGLR